MALNINLPLSARWARPVVLYTALVLFFGACTSPRPAVPEGAARHVVVIVVDTLRADHLPTYGYQRDTAPFLTDLAKTGTVFTHAVTTSSFTAEAISSLFTGQYPSETPWGGGWYARPAPDGATLASTFRAAGYETALFSNSPVLDSPEFYRGFDTTYCFSEFGVSGQGPRLVEKALRWLEDHQDKPTFTYLHFLDPHSPFTPPEAYYDKFGTARPPVELGLYEDVRENVTGLRAEGFGPGEPRFDNLVQRYDGEIAFIDDTLRTFFTALNDMGMASDTLAVITADHGEEFLDHGFVEHAWTLYPEVHHIPLIFWRPGHIPVKTVPQTTSLVDIMPTLFRLQGLNEEGPSLFAPTPGGPWTPTPIAGPRVMEMLIQSRSLVRGVVTDDVLYLAWWKYLSPEASSEAARTIRTTRAALLDGTQAPIDTWGPIVHEELYDLKADPGAQKNIAGENPEAVDRWRRYLQEYQDRCPPQLSDRFKGTRDVRLLTEEERKGLNGVAPEFLVPLVPDDTHDHSLESLGYL